MSANNFRKYLGRLIEAVPGALSASIMGSDGIPIDVINHDMMDVDATNLFVEYGGLLEQFKTTAQMFAAGELEELSAQTEQFTCVMRPITPEFFLALVLSPKASIGRSRFLLRIHAPLIRPDLL